MLKCEDGGGDEDCNLLTAKDSLKRGTQCHLGFTEADITAKQSVHRHGADHIRLYIVDCGKLTVGRLILKLVLEAVLKLRLPREGKAGASLSFGIEIYKLFCKLLRGGARLILRTGPLCAAHFRQLDLSVLVSLADVFSKHIKSFAPDKKPIRAGVSYADIVVGNTADGHRLDTLKKTDTVGGVYYIVARLKLRVAHKAFYATSPACHTLTLLVCHNRPAVGDSHRQNRNSHGYEIKAVVRADIDKQASRGCLADINLGAVKNGDGRDAVCGKILTKALGTCTGLAKKDGAIARLPEAVKVLNKHGDVVAVGNGRTAAEAEKAGQLVAADTARKGVYMHGKIACKIPVIVINCK